MNIIADNVMLDKYYSAIFDSNKDKRYILYDKESKIDDKLKLIDPSLCLKKIVLGSFSELLVINEIFEKYIQNDIKTDVINKFANERDYIISFFENRINKEIELKKEIEKEEKKKINKYIEDQICGILDVTSILYENGTISKIISEFFMRQNDYLAIKGCYYCNIDFVNVFDKNRSYHFTLDHVLPKNKFPYFSISLFNLVPSCYPCNSKFKHNKEFTINKELNKICPSSDLCDVDELIEFKMKFDVNNSSFEEKIKKNIEVDDVLVKLENKLSLEGIDEYIQIFKLQSRYEFHKNISFDLIEKRKIYSDSQIDEIEKIFQNEGILIDKETFKKQIFGSVIFEKENTNEPFEKYKKNIAKELGIIK
ncbi:hypothetical protein GKZ90_0002435 [Flavobacterium sp. MC2016-06]|uniref:HNH endonuclease n=1 Tax=Flavobacterium sp. MC2016-06 TaxID=2676308 RepID=UPI0012BB1D35|nr:hypothetical protein [Flavobacterium sp. MC2016-06]MBU3858270.1 hypothetical protein [Flavobacterium sp. MC2016-06]